jgi:hypothetical protein
MSGPPTVELPHMTPWVEVNPKAGSSASVHSKINSDNNSHVPYVWFNGILAALALGIAIGAMIVTLVVSSRSTVSENHWRDIETNNKVLSKRVEYLENAIHDRR